MNIEEILDVIDELLDRAWNLPLTGGRCVVDADKVRDLIDEVRLNLPGEIKQARSIVADRAEIISVARQEAETIVQKAEERAKALISREDIVKQSQARAAEIMQSAQMKSREMRSAANDYSEKVLRETEESLTRSLSDVKNTRQALRNATRK
ncbi:MAG: ATP synthase F0 subunit B [Provencibacterium sp.]|nr:ATP synthase F0 subunit B [Provencibacterium sp.]